MIITSSGWLRNSGKDWKVEDGLKRSTITCYGLVG